MSVSAGKRKADTTSAEEERRGGVFIIQRLRKIKTNGHESFVKTCNVFLLFASICIHILYCVVGVKLEKVLARPEIVRQPQQISGSE